MISVDSVGVVSKFTLLAVKWRLYLCSSSDQTLLQGLQRRWWWGRGFYPFGYPAGAMWASSRCSGRAEFGGRECRGQDYGGQLSGGWDCEGQLSVGQDCDGQLSGAWRCVGWSCGV